MYAYLDASNDVVATSTAEYTLAEAQALIPSITEVIASAPLELVAKDQPVSGRPPYWHRRVSGDGTSFSDYQERPIVTRYTYSVGNDTANGAVAVDRLEVEIQRSSIATSLSSVSALADVLDVAFPTALSGADETTLDSLVAAHDGVPLRPLEVVGVDPPLEPVVPGASQVVANDRPAIEVNTGVTGWAAASVVWPLELFSHAELRLRVHFIMKESGTGSNVRISGRVKSNDTGDDSSAAFIDTTFAIVPITYTTVGEVFEAVLWLDASSFNEEGSLAVQAGRDGNDELGAGTSDDASVPIQIISISLKGR